MVEAGVPTARYESFTDARSGVGLPELLDAIARHFPSPLEGNPMPFLSGEGQDERPFTYQPDISKTLPVISLATGRVVEIDARLGDVVKKGQVLLRIESADLAGVAGSRGCGSHGPAD